MSQFRDVDSPMGDFAYDIMRDRDYPPQEQTQVRLEQYFDHKARIMQNYAVSRLFQIAWAFYDELYSPPAG